MGHAPADEIESDTVKIIAYTTQPIRIGTGGCAVSLFISIVFVLINYPAASYGVLNRNYLNASRGGELNPCPPSAD
jgi:hypothetical protein